MPFHTGGSAKNGLGGDPHTAIFPSVCQGTGRHLIDLDQPLLDLSNTSNSNVQFHSANYKKGKGEGIWKCRITSYLVAFITITISQMS